VRAGVSGWRLPSTPVKWRAQINNMILSFLEF
jgi:hypothetical protein